MITLVRVETHMYIRPGEEEELTLKERVEGKNSPRIPINSSSDRPASSGPRGGGGGGGDQCVCECVLLNIPPRNRNALCSEYSAASERHTKMTQVPTKAVGTMLMVEEEEEEEGRQLI